MLGLTGRYIAHLLYSTSCRHQPWQIASAVALGLACGLLPLASLWSLPLLACLFLLPIHLPVAVVVAAIVTTLRPMLVPGMGQVGLWALAQPNVIHFVDILNSYPLVAWLRLNNSVVHGAIWIGAAQLIPTFMLMRPLARLVLSARDETYEEYENQAIASTQLQEMKPQVSYLNIDFEDVLESEDQETPSLSRDLGQPELEIAAELDSVDALSAKRLHSRHSTFRDAPTERSSRTPIERVESFLSECSDSNVDELGASDVATRAFELASLVDEMLVALQEEEKSAFENRNIPISAEHPAHSGDESSADLTPNLRFLSRIPNVADTKDDSQAGKSRQAFEPSEREFLEQEHSGLQYSGMHDSERKQMPTTARSTDDRVLDVRSQHVLNIQVGQDDATKVPAPGENTKEGTVLVAHVSHDQLPAAKSMGPAVHQNVSPHEEALRYLLHHLKEIKNKA